MKMSVGTKLYLGFGAVVVIGLVQGVFAIQKMQELNALTVEIQTSWLPSVKYSSFMNTTISEYRVAKFLAASAQSPEQFDRATKQMQDQLKQLESQRKSYEPLITSPEEKKLYEQFVSQWSQYTQDDEKIMDQLKNGRKAEATAIMQGGAAKMFRQASDTLEEIVNLNDQGGNLAKIRGEKLFSNVTILVWTTIVLGLIVGMTLAFFLVRGVQNLLAETLGGGFLRSLPECRM